ncbi:MAG TPA: mannose-1-phosphate guanylyltransferase [Phototrophicaceae bacterium]|nr:mannose-1-phosphate guanylyltransferase [Phototrophicaceae bacterium]
MQHYYAMIMAGGGGTRLWPMSRQDMPKQLLSLVEEFSMFKTSVDRLAPLFTPDRIYVVTGRKYVDTMRAQVPEIPAENFIIEPYGKDSGPAAALGMTVIQKRDPQATVAVLAADHHITHKEKFRDVLAAAYDVAQQGYIVTLGISPSYPATGFGYIRQGEKLCDSNGFTCYHSRGFTEKPNVVTATTFLASGEYSWNSGMFIWTAKRAMEEFTRQQPAMHTSLMKLQPAVDTHEFEEKLDEAWNEITKISLDYAVMEGAEKIAVIPVDIGWNDVGSWASLYEVLKLDKFGNGFKGRQPERVILDTRNTLVYSDKLTVTIGVNDLIVIETPDALLICHKDRTQDVKDVVNHLLTTKNYKYL